MVCDARCSCFLCRELQACRADARRPPRPAVDNFILRKAEAWEPMKFIRGAARLSVRQWGREPPPRHKSTSCEQLCPAPEDTPLRRAPSTDRLKPDHKPLFRLLGSRSKKTDEPKRRSVLNFRKNEVPNSKDIHEKYIPLSPAEHVYSEPRPRADDCCRPPAYRPADHKPYTRPPCYDELAQRLSQENSKKTKQINSDPVLSNKITQNNNKVVIYFGDSIIRKHSEQKAEKCEPKEEVIYANRLLDETGNLGLGGEGSKLVSEVQVAEPTVEAPPVEVNAATYKKDVWERVGADGFLVVEFEGNYERARRLVDAVQAGAGAGEATLLDDVACDWSFIQNWRRRPSSGCRPAESDSWWSETADGGVGARALRVRVCAAAAPAHARRLAPPPHAHTATAPPVPPVPPAPPDIAQPQSPSNAIAKPMEEAPTPAEPATVTARPGAAVVATTTATAATSTPVRLATPRTSSALTRPREHHHTPAEPAAPTQNVSLECNSSSDENRSSGHASMSDSGGGDARADPRAEPRRARKDAARAKHRPHNKLQSPWPGGGGLEDIRSAIKQLTLRSRDSSSTATSGASSAGGGSNNGAPESAGSAGSAGSGEARRRRAPLARQPSLDTVCTNVTSADEFVWVDSHNRLVELRSVPWTPGEVARALAAGRARDLAPRLAPDTPARLAYLLQRALVRIAREAQRLSQNFGFCSKHEVAGAFRIILSTPLADACIKSCQRAATMFATGGAARRLASAARARTALSPGRFQRWMLDARVAPFVHEYAAVYLCAGMECLLEEVAVCAGSTGAGGPLTPAALDHAVANCADLWGLLQPYSHLNAGRVASGALSLSRWESMSSLGSGSSTGARPETRQLGLSHDSGITTNGSGGSGTSSGGSGGSGASEASRASVLLTTCASSPAELRAVLRRAAPRHAPLTPSAERALYYFMRCSQLEHGGAGACGGLWGARAGALPPLGEWVRVARAHAGLRAAPAAPAPPDADDVRQAARLLLPHADCPPRPITMEEGVESWTRGSGEMRPSGLDVPDSSGLTPLMKASLAGDEHLVSMLLEAGADPNVETPGAAAQPSALLSPRSGAPPAFTPPTAGWTALVYACAGAGAAEVARRLLAAGARVDGAAARSDDVCTITPLQMACGVGNLELVQLLLSHGADPFLSTQLNDALCYSAAAQYGCYSAVAVCCAHGRRACLRAAVRGGRGAGATLSLEEVLAEGAAPAAAAPAFTKQQMRALQDAMYYASETDHLDMTLELRGLGVAWSLHAWTLSLAAAADAALDHVIDQLLQDFLQVCPSDDSHYSKQFIYECLPLLFNILRYSKKEGTVLLLADILCACYGWEPVPRVLEPPPPVHPAHPAHRVDPQYVNNPELADVTFRVEGRLFYGHKIVLVSESPRLRAMLAPARDAPPTSAAPPPLVQINDIRYHIFEYVMKYLYCGGCSTLEIPEADVLEVLAAAAFFQLLPLQRHCEARAARALDLHNLVSTYIHAKVYGATQLLEYCQGFLLQNMVALLTYDDSVKRLLFGKRLPGHNVLAALLATLQKRLETRKNQAKTR